MLKRWFGRRSPAARGPQVVFRCEHDGVPERELKNGLTKVFAARRDVEKAFLAVVSFTGGAENGVALCMTGVKVEDRPGLAGEIGVVFANLFRAEEHLDLWFPTEEEEGRLAKVCRPFWTRP